jgi:hypothetical protein
MFNKNQSGVVVLLIPVLIFMLGFVIAIPLFIFSMVKTLSVSNVYQYLFGSDAAGASYSNPGSVISGKGDHVLPNFQCIPSGGPGQCGVTATAMALTSLTGKQYTPKGLLSTDGGGPNSVPIEATLDKYTKVTWETTNWDFNRIQRSIDQGYPVIIYSTFPGTGTEHITVVWGYRNDGHLIVNSAYNYKCVTIYPTAAEYMRLGTHPGRARQMVIASQIK